MNEEYKENLENPLEKYGRDITESVKQGKVDPVIGRDEEIRKVENKKQSKDEIEKYSELDLEAAYIYKLMNTGYSYQEKTIKKYNVTDEEYALIAEKLDELKKNSELNQK